MAESPTITAKRWLEELYSAYIRAPSGRAKQESGEAFVVAVRELISADLGFVSCTVESVPKRSRKKTKEPERPCLYNIVCDNVEVCDDQDCGGVLLRQLINAPTQMDHLVLSGTRHNMDVVVHVYNLWDAPPDLEGYCPCKYIAKHIGGCNGGVLAVPVLCVVVGQKSRVVWVVEPQCEVVDKEALALPSYQRVRWASIVAARSQQETRIAEGAPPTGPSAFQMLKLGKDYFYEGYTRFRQRYLEYHKEISAEDAEYLPFDNEFYQLWLACTSTRTESGLVDQRLEWRLTKRALQVGLESRGSKLSPEQVGKIFDFVKSKNRAELKSGETVTWEACVQSVNMFGYWWTNPEDMLHILSTSYTTEPSNSELVEAPALKRWYVVRSSKDQTRLTVEFTPLNTINRFGIAFDWEKNCFYLIHNKFKWCKSLCELIESELNTYCQIDKRVPEPMPKGGTAFYVNAASR